MGKETSWIIKMNAQISYSGKLFIICFPVPWENRTRTPDKCAWRGKEANWR